MGNTRIHKLASDWGVASKDVIERLDRMGIAGKKAQSSLTDSEAQRVRSEMGLDEAPEAEEPAVTHRTVEVREPGAGAVTAVDTITETRVKRGVVLRRTKRTSIGGGPEIPALRIPTSARAATAVDISPDALCALELGEFASASASLRLMSAGSAALAIELPPEPVAPPVETPQIDEVAPTAARTSESASESQEIDAVVPASDEATATAESPVDSAGSARVDGPAAPAAETPLSAESTLVEADAPAMAEPKQPVAVVPAPPGAAPPTPGKPGYKEEDEGEVAPIEEPDKLAEEMLSRAEAAENGEATPAADARPGGARVLGRIDLSRKAKPVLPAKAAETKEKEAEAEKPGRKKKRKVVRKEDMFDAFERSVAGRARRPMKKRVAPGQKVAKTELTTPKASKRVVKVNEATSPGELAKSMGIKAGDVLGVMMRLGVMKSINDLIDIDTAMLVADEFGYTVENTAVKVEELLERPTDTREVDGELLPRPPVVTVMGHVDHGKTSLLDAIRKSDVVAGESGGITQHIGAYMVSTSQGDICFLDTPGHAAFTEMRARGAKVTDVVVLVVAADDGVMPQTIEAINHAKAAGLPVVVAVNKIDRPDANMDRIKQQLSEHGLQPEDWGGDTQFVPVSALQKQGIEELLEAIVLSAQMLELKAVADTRARGFVVEARLDKGRGPVATVLVQEGTLRRGDYFVVGETTGRVRAMMDHASRQVQEAPPSHAVEIIGLDAVPQAGDAFDAVEDLARASQVAEHRVDQSRSQQASVSARMSLEDLQRQVAAGDVGELKAIIKADVQGTAEAVKQALEKLSTDEVKLVVIHQAVGAITESDVQLALASNAVIVGFHVRPEGKARTLAEREGVDIRLHTVIYEAIDEVKAALEGMLAPDFREEFEGRAEVRDTFTVPGGNTIAGSYVTEGKMTRNAQCRLLRDNVVIHTGTVGSLRRFKDDVREVQTSYECGIGLERYNDIKVGDMIECFRMEAVKRSLGDRRPAAKPENEAEKQPDA